MLVTFATSTVVEIILLCFVDIFNGQSLQTVFISTGSSSSSAVLYKNLLVVDCNIIDIINQLVILVGVGLAYRQIVRTINRNCIIGKRLNKGFLRVYTLLAVCVLETVGVVAGVVVTAAVCGSAIAGVAVSCAVAAVTVSVLPRIGVAVLRLPLALEGAVLMNLAGGGCIADLENAVVVAVVGGCLGDIRLNLRCGI